MTTKSWSINLDGIQHTIELEHGYFSGKREIKVDGRLIEKSSRIMDHGSDHVFNLGEHACAVHIGTNGFTFNYDFSVDGKSIQTGKVVGFKNISLNSPNLNSASMMQLQVKVENRLKNGANWFFWIAGLSVLNSFIYLFGGQIHFIAGLGITQLVDGLITDLIKYYFSEFSTILQIIGVAITIVMSSFFVIFGFLARKSYRWAFITGMVFYGLDTLILLWAGDYLGLLFHIIALSGLFSGYKAINEVNRLNEILAQKNVPVYQ